MLYGRIKDTVRSSSTILVNIYVNVPHPELILCGHSLGAGVAALLALVRCLITVQMGSR